MANRRYNKVRNAQDSSCSLPRAPACANRVPIAAPLPALGNCQRIYVWVKYFRRFALDLRANPHATTETY